MHTMTREDAIDVLTLRRDMHEETAKALDMAIEALSQPIVCKDYRIDDDHIYCSPKMADRVVEALSEPSGDLISRADAIAYIDRVINSGLGKNKSLEYIRKYVEKVPSVSAERSVEWIPCSERLPKVGEICLLTVHEYGWNCEEYTRVIIGKHSNNYADHILAWMPLPKPYREDGEV